MADQGLVEGGGGGGSTWGLGGLDPQGNGEYGVRLGKLLIKYSLEKSF